MNTIHNLAFLCLCQSLFVSDQAIQFQESSTLLNCPQEQKSGKAGVANIVFKSTDGGETWQDISEGLPENLKNDLWRDDFFADENGLYLRAYKDGIYHNKINSAAPFWQKERSPIEQGSLAPGKAGMFAYNDNGQFLHKKNGTTVWSSMYKNFPVGAARTVFETAAGTIFIGRDYGLFKSDDRGRSWKIVFDEGYVVVTDFAESEGVLIGTGRSGILRSIDNGEHWEWVINDSSPGKSVTRIDGGFAAISYDPQTGIDRIHISLDKGKTWQAIDNGLPPSMNISSIKQAGKYLICGHPSGIYRSSDKGKTWQLLLNSVEGKVFNLSVSGNIIYAIPLSPGC